MQEGSACLAGLFQQDAAILRLIGILLQDVIMPVGRQGVKKGIGGLIPQSLLRFITRYNSQEFKALKEAKRTYILGPGLALG